MRRGLPPGHYGFASLASERSLLAQGEGKISTALDLANQAVMMDEAAVKAGGEGGHLLPVLLVRRANIELDARQPDRAVADAARALSLAQQTVGPGFFSEHVGRAYLALGRALDAQGKRDDARAAFRSAYDHLQDALGPDHVDTRTARQLAQIPGST